VLFGITGIPSVEVNPNQPFPPGGGGGGR